MNKFLICSVGTILIALMISSCLETDNAYPKVAPGIWRGVLTLEKNYYPSKDEKKKDIVMFDHDQTRDGELPFNFTVNYTSNDKLYVEIINGSEKIRCDSVSFGHDRSTARDTMNIYFPEYQSYIHVEVRGNLMEGYWDVTTKDNYRIHFQAKSGKDHRFTTLQETPITDISGEWATLFGVNETKPDKAIGEFKQKGNHLEGTFRTETGDYRFLEGTVQGNKIYLSCFDGSHAFLFRAKIKGDSIQGEFLSGIHHKSLWTAWKDKNFKLGSPDSLTTLKSETSGIQFALKTPEGTTLQFPSNESAGKINIITVSGTWCPNCKDEQLFLADFLKNNPTAANEMSIVSLSFERYKDEAKANQQLTIYRKKLGIPYPVLLAGKSSLDEVSRVLPALKDVMAFPTMIITDKKGKIRQVHTGFDGPASSKHAEFKKEFSALIEKLLKE